MPVRCKTHSKLDSKIAILIPAESYSGVIGDWLRRDVTATDAGDDAIKTLSRDAAFCREQRQKQIY